MQVGQGVVGQKVGRGLHLTRSSYLAERGGEEPFAKVVAFEAVEVAFEVEPFVVEVAFVVGAAWAAFVVAASVVAASVVAVEPYVAVVAFVVVEVDVVEVRIDVA